jgi:hypothetical protein
LTRIEEVWRVLDEHVPVDSLAVDDGDSDALTSGLTAAETLSDSARATRSSGSFAGRWRRHNLHSLLRPRPDTNAGYPSTSRISA